jgi:hypothetical protein
MQREPPRAPTKSMLRRPTRSTRYRSQMMVSVVLTTPKIPVVRKDVFWPVIPMLLNTVGE